MAAAAGQELGALQAKTLVKVLKHAMSVVQGAPHGSAAAAAVRFMQQLCSTSSSARRCVLDAGGCHFLSLCIQHAVQHSNPISPAMEASACAASDALCNLAVADAKRVASDCFPHLAAALGTAAQPATAGSAARALALASPIIIAAAPALQSAKQLHAILQPFSAAAQLLSPNSSSPSLPSTAHAFAVLLACTPLPSQPSAAALPPPLALYLNLLEGAGPLQFRVAAATHARLLLAPHAASHTHARAIINSLFHTALLPFTGSLPPLQCAAVSSLSSAALLPSLQGVVSESLSLSDVISLLPTLPADVAASVARLAAAAAMDAGSCARLVDMRVDELITNACAANPKSKELREAAGDVVLRLSLHAKGRSSIILTHRSLPLIMALVDYSKDPQHQARAIVAVGNLAQEKFNRYQLAFGGVLDELKRVLLDEQQSDAIKAQCLRVVGLILSTNHPAGDDFASKFVSKSALYEICRLADSPQPLVHRNAVWVLAALTQNPAILPALGVCCKKLMKVLQHGSMEGKRYATFAVSNLACNERVKEFFLSSDCVRLLRANLVYKQDPMLFGATSQALYNLQHKDPQLFNVPELTRA